MEQSFNNVALFIKRAEEYQTREFIIDAFSSKNIGKVRDVKFIKKHNDFGSNYNGVIVVFERWNNNKLVQTLFQEMSESSDGTTKFYFNSNRFWYIKIHQQKLSDTEESTGVDSSLPDKERIEQLEALVKSMSTQLHYMQTRQERSERIMMDCERKDTQHHLYNMELRSQLDEKDMERSWAEDEYKKEIEKLHNEKEVLRCRLALNAIKFARKERQCNILREELRDNISILNYVENQAKEMRAMLKGVSASDPVKPEIDLYMKEYLY